MSDCDFKIHSRIYPGKFPAYQLFPVPFRPIPFTIQSHFWPPWTPFFHPNGSKVYNSQSIAEEIFDPILKYILILHVLSHHSHFITHQSFWKNTAKNFLKYVNRWLLFSYQSGQQLYGALMMHIRKKGSLIILISSNCLFRLSGRQRILYRLPWKMLLMSITINN